MTEQQDKTTTLVESFLDRNRRSLSTMSVDEAMPWVRVWVIFPRKVPDAELRSIIQHYYLLHVLPKDVLPMPSRPLDAITNAVEEKMKAPIERVEVERTGGKLHIGVTGLTAELNRGFGKTAVGVSWGGTLTVEEAFGNFHFSFTLNKDHWELGLSYPDATPMPDLGKLGDVFGEGEEALRGIIRDSQGWSDAGEIRRKWKDFNEHMERVKRIVEAVNGIARTPSNWNLSIVASGPMPSPGDEKLSEGIQVIVRLTAKFGWWWL